jgi:GNAT superfamily N-acetyltransferase
LASGTSRRSASGIKVRRATLKDLPELVHQRRAMWEDLGVKGKAEHDRADQIYGRWIRSRMKNERLVGWIAAKRDGTVAGGGCVWLQEVQPRPHRKGTLQPYLLSMYTEPEFRGKGVASKIVEAAIDWTRKQGYERLQLHASEMGRGVYKRLGFKRTWEMRFNINRPRR